MAWGRPDGRSGVASATSALVSWLQVPALNPGPAIDIAGESHYQDALEQVGGGRSAFGVRNQLITVELVREPANLTTPTRSRSRPMAITWAICRGRTLPASTP
jgi:hypothetical protein